MKYKSKIQLLHTDGEAVTIEVTGSSAKKVAHITNQIKDRYAQNMDKTVIESERLWYDFLRDFFHLRKGK